MHPSFFPRSHGNRTLASAAATAAPSGRPTTAPTAPEGHPFDPSPVPTGSPTPVPSPVPTPAENAGWSVGGEIGAEPVASVEPGCTQICDTSWGPIYNHLDRMDRFTKKKLNRTFTYVDTEINKLVSTAICAYSRTFWASLSASTSPPSGTSHSP